MTTIKKMNIGFVALGIAAIASIANAQEARFTVGDLSNSDSRAAFDHKLASATTTFCGEQNDSLGHLTGYKSAADYQACASAVRDEVFGQLSPLRQQQYAAATAAPFRVASTEH